MQLPALESRFMVKGLGSLDSPGPCKHAQRAGHIMFASENELKGLTHSQLPKIEKSTLFTCPCHKIFSLKAGNPLLSNNTLKLRFYEYVKFGTISQIMSKNHLIKVRI